MKFLWPNFFRVELLFCVKVEPRIHLLLTMLHKNSGLEHYCVPLLHSLNSFDRYPMLYLHIYLCGHSLICWRDQVLKHILFFMNWGILSYYEQCFCYLLTYLYYWFMINFLFLFRYDVEKILFIKGCHVSIVLHMFTLYFK